MRMLLALPLIGLGIVAIIAGGSDDSPGLQGLGLIMIVSVTVFSYRSRKAK
jgi:hypothetical protein